MRVHTCELCRKPFLSSRSHVRFCGVSCRVAFHRWNKTKGSDFVETKLQQNNRLKQLILGM